MIFWDASALVPLLVEEEHTARAVETARRDGRLIVWWGTPVEVLSAIARSEREGRLAPDEADEARRTLRALADTWSEVLPVETVRSAATRLLRRHDLRAADALQLAAALSWARGHPEDCELFTLDDRLAQAARREGFALSVAP